MNFSVIRTVKKPQRANDFDAGVDFYVPKFSEDFKQYLIAKNSFVDIFSNKIRIGPHERILIPSGIKVAIPQGTALIAFNKSGVSSKKGLDILACVIDSGYQGEIHLSLVNTSNDSIFIEEDEKLVQFIHLPIFVNDWLEVEEKTLFASISSRGDGGFGSTN